MSLVDILLGKAGELKNLPKKRFELKRLSTAKEPFVITVRALAWDEIRLLPDNDDRILNWVLKAVEGIDFTDEKLRTAFLPEGRKTPLTPPELIEALLLPGEIIKIQTISAELSGWNDSLTEIEKNSATSRETRS